MRMMMENSMEMTTENIVFNIAKEYRERYTQFDESYLESVVEDFYKNMPYVKMKIKIEVWKRCVEELDASY